ncbi:MAG: NAD-dependent epimerase/dehydratase family protein [Pseudomonadota bacterium]
MRTALITGTAGFIGFHLAKTLLDHDFRVIGFDALTDYYDVSLKRRRHQMLLQSPHFSCVEARLEEPERLSTLMEQEKPDVVVHLAAQAGVRYSIDDPRSYLESNLAGTLELLEAVRHHPCSHLLIASTSAVYGANTEMPFEETQKADTQMSFYAATKKANEAMAHSYAHLFGIPVTLFRFFTVYGPWGRPDMALFKFTRAILEDQPIDIYNHGDMYRDFTYVGDLVEGIRLLIDAVPERPESMEAIAPGDSLSPVAPCRVVNIGNSNIVRLMDFVSALESALGRTAKKNFMELQPGDVPATWANTALLESLTGFKPKTDVETGVARFVEWYRNHYADESNSGLD